MTIPKADRVSSPVASPSVDSVPVVTRHRFPNGLTLLIQEDHSHPLVAFQAAVPTGSATEGRFLGTGISHVVEHMLFKGTQRRGVGEVEKEARSYGGTSQGFTNYDTTAYQLVVNREHWSSAADLLIDALFNSTFDPGEFAKEREVVLRELKMRDDDPSQLSWEILFANAYRVHPYQIPIIGYEPLLTQLTAEDAKAYYRSWYFPNTMVLAVVGDVDTEAVIKTIGELTAAIPPGRVPLETLPEEPFPQLAGRQIVEQSAALTMPMIEVGFLSVSIRDPDLFALDLLAWILGGDRGSRLDRMLKEAGLVHSVNAFNYTPRDRGVLTIALRLDSDKKELAMDALRKELLRVQSGGITETELQSARKAVLRGYWSGKQQVADIAGDLCGNEILTGDPLFSRRYLQGLRQVTRDDLRRVARKYLQIDQATVVTMLPEQEPVELKQSVVKTETVPVEKKTLRNGIRLILKPDRRIGLVNLQVSMPGGVLWETDSSSGLSALTAHMLLRGTRSKNADQITDAMKRMGGQVGTASGRNGIGLSMEVIGAELPRAVALLSEILQQSVFPSAELEKEKSLALAHLKEQEEDPFPWGIRRLMRLLFTKHPYHLDPAGSEESIKLISRESCARFYTRAADPRSLVIAVVGDFDPKQVLALLEQSLGRMEKPAENSFVVEPEPELTRRLEIEEKTPRHEQLVLIGFRGLKLGDPRIPALDLAEAVLSGGAGRLFDEVREKQGLAYTVGAFGVPGLDPGSFVIYAMADPGNRARVEQSLWNEIARLREEPVPVKELEEAKQGLLGAHRVARQTQSAVAGQLASNELYGLGFDYDERYEAMIQSLTAADVQRVARELLDSNRCVVWTSLPSDANASSGE